MRAEAQKAQAIVSVPVSSIVYPYATFIQPAGPYWMRTRAYGPLDVELDAAIDEAVRVVGQHEHEQHRRHDVQDRPASGRRTVRRGR